MLNVRVELVLSTFQKGKSEMNRTILNEIKLERVRQAHNPKTSVVFDDSLNTPATWLFKILLQIPPFKSLQVLNKNQVSEFRAALIKMAALCVAAVESIDRQRAKNGKPFYEDN